MSLFDRKLILLIFTCYIALFTLLLFVR